MREWSRSKTQKDQLGRRVSVAKVSTPSSWIAAVDEHFIAKPLSELWLIRCFRALIKSRQSSWSSTKKMRICDDEETSDRRARRMTRAVRVNVESMKCEELWPLVGEGAKPLFSSADLVGDIVS